MNKSSIGLAFAVSCVAIATLLSACQQAPVESPAASAGTPAASAASAQSAADDKGIGPVHSVALGPIDKTMVKHGEATFKERCAACHHMDDRFVGPALGEVTKRRTPEFVMNMILNPQEMTQKDPVARDMLAEYTTQMGTCGLAETDARNILEYLRSVAK